MFGLFLNARVLMKREGRRLANSLTLLVAIGILLLSYYRLSIQRVCFQSTSSPFLVEFHSLRFIFYPFIQFLSAYFLYQFNRPRLNQDFIIVLGSGLINDKVPPLLASRIQKAIDFYHKQAAVTTPPTIIFSGGQGPDENLPEAEAMQRYAIEKAFPLSIHSRRTAL